MGKKRPKKTGPVVPAGQPPEVVELLADLRSLIDAGRTHVAQAVNVGMVLLYWSVGDRIRTEILKHKRAAYGEEIVSALSRQLSAEYGRGFGRSNLFNMVLFAETFADRQIVQTLSGQLSWSHFLLLLPLKDRLKRDFYAEMCRLERWSVRVLRAKIDRLLYERTALAKKSEAVIEQELQSLRDEDHLTPDLVFRDPYLLDFLQLHDSYAEADVEAAILRELEAFLLELGGDFTFVCVGSSRWS
jgi:predicted nuclease of restriction endonuclease-like (RecB) superfamily